LAQKAEGICGEYAEGPDKDLDTWLGR